VKRIFLATVLIASCALTGPPVGPVVWAGSSAAARADGARLGQRPRRVTARRAQPREQDCPASPVPEGFLSLVLKLSTGGNFEILKATLVPGKLIVPGTTRAEYLYEVTSDGKFLAAGLLADDPFLMRSYGDPRAGGVEGVRVVGATTIILHIPNVTDATVAAGRIGLKLYALRGDPPDKPDADTLRDLKARGLLVTRLELPEKKLGPAIRQKMGRGL